MQWYPRPVNTEVAPPWCLVFRGFPGVTDEGRVCQARVVWVPAVTATSCHLPAPLALSLHQEKNVSPRFYNQILWKMRRNFFLPSVVHLNAYGVVDFQCTPYYLTQCCFWVLLRNPFFNLALGFKMPGHWYIGQALKRHIWQDLNPQLFL